MVSLLGFLLFCQLSCLVLFITTVAYVSRSKMLIFIDAEMILFVLLKT